MEEGSLRCDANVSVRTDGSSPLGTKAEIKNLNSFRFLEEALEHEIERQIEVVESGGRVVQETRLWDSAKKRTVSMRSKEEAHDYRYFPEPDLPPLVIDPARLQQAKDGLPETPGDAARPAEGGARLLGRRGRADHGARGSRRTSRRRSPRAPTRRSRGTGCSAPFARTMNEAGGDPAWLRERLAPARLAGLLVLVANGTISGSMAKDVFEKMVATGRAADEIVAAEGLAQIDDESQILGLIAAVLEKNADAVAQYRSGKTNALGFLVGQVMKATAGKANPSRVNELLRRSLGT